MGWAVMYRKGLGFKDSRQMRNMWGGDGNEANVRNVLRSW
jgi:hypothetical protein